MHHALAGWASWPDWAEYVGGRFLYQPGAARGAARLDSGYRHDVSYIAEVVAEHPATLGLPPTFEVTDELYLAEVFETDVVPLVRAGCAFTADNFYSAAAAVAGRMYDNREWPHPPGSDLVAWAKRAKTAPLVYLQFGDGPSAWGNPHLRRLLAQSLDWVASPHGREWAAT
jgi:uncharacterized protein